MTNEGGSRRHPSNRGSMAPDQWVPGEFIAHRTLDPIRAAALNAAVTLCREPDVSTREVLTVAKDFEQYLTGKEADDPTDR